MGDRILSVNGADIRDASHETAVMSLLSKADTMKLKVLHDPLPKGFQVKTAIILGGKMHIQLYRARKVQSSPDMVFLNTKNWSLRCYTMKLGIESQPTNT